MANPMDKAERAFKKEEQRREGVKNVGDYQQAMVAEEKKTARLRALRLAHEAQQAEADAAAPPTKKKKPAKKVKKADETTA